MTDENIINADVAIVGSGVAGALAACKLAKLGIKNIVMIEAGPRIERVDVVDKFKKSLLQDPVAGFVNAGWAPRPDWTNKDNPYMELVGPTAFQLDYLRIVGGTTWHWGGCTPRLLPSDFAIASTYGVGHDWPFDYKTLEPYYTEAEEEMGVAGEGDDGSWRSKDFPLPKVPLTYSAKIVSEGLAKLGIQTGSRPAARATQPYKTRGQCVGFGTCSPICPSGAQYGAIYHVEEAEKLGVRLLENTRVDKIVTQGAVTQLEAKKPDGSSITIRAKIFVLAANAIETPRLMLMSAGESRPAGIGNSSGIVGKYFMEHPSLNCRIRMPQPVYPGRGPGGIMVSPHFRDGEFRQHRPGMQLTLENRIAFQGIANDALAKNGTPTEIDAEIRDRAIHEIELHGNLEQLPDPQNGISLNWAKRDSAGQPIMRFYYSFSDYEKAGFAFVRETYKRIATALGGDIVATFDPAPENHPMGMTRMGKDPKTSVTDGFGRCHDHKNLFIISSSLFPSAGCVNPTLTIAALALRTAEEIKRQLGNL